MINEDVLAGIRAGLERGQSLKDSMISLYNAGYTREEIEEAARALVNAGPVVRQIEPVQQKQIKQVISKPKPIALPAKVPQKVFIPQPKVLIPERVKPEKTSQKISEYTSEKPKRKKDVVIVILIFLLIILFGMLGLIILFKQQLISWFSSII